MRPALRRLRDLPTPLRQLVAGCLLGLIWFALWRVAALLGVQDSVSLWYPPAGLTFAVALLLLRRHLSVFVIMVVVGTALGRGIDATLQAPFDGVAHILVQAAAHGLPYLIAAILVRRFSASRQGAAGYSVLALLVAAPLAALAAATGGVAVLTLRSELGPDTPDGMLVTWFVGDLVGVATAAPFLASLLAPRLFAALGRGVERRGLGDTAPWPSLRLLALLASSALALTAMGVVDGSEWPPGTVTAAAYVPLVAMLVIARLEPTTHAYCALFLLALGVAFTACGADGAIGSPEPTLLLIALAAVTLLGVELRRVTAESRLDPLTGALNRRQWLRAAEFARARGHKVSIVLVDLDRFKIINDRFGHAAGDRVLRATARRLLDAAPGNAVIGRIGGEEFALLLALDCHEAALVAERLRYTLVAGARSMPPEDVSVSASFGVAELTGASSLEKVLRDADDALYRAKAAGRNRVSVAPSPVAQQRQPRTTCVV